MRKPMIMSAVALSIVSLTVLAPAAPAHGQTLTTKQRYTLPYAIAGCTPRLYKTQHLGDGSTNVTFSCINPQGRNAVLLYGLNVGNPTFAAARAASADFRENFGDPSFDGGVIRTYHSGLVWGVTEFGPQHNRITIGGPLHRVAMVTSVIFDDPADSGWATTYGFKISKALVARIP